MIDELEPYREEVLVTASRAVLAALRGPLETRDLPPPALAALRLLETALERYNGSALTL